MFKHPLDQDSLYTRYDQGKVYDSILGLKNQIEQSWIEISHQVFKGSFESISDIVVCGMGGSALGGRIVRSLDQYILNVPLEVDTNYRLPNYVNEKTLVILVSYSGSTEETISALLDALARNAKIFIVASGGKLLEIAKEKGLDHFVIDPKFNPSDMPRLGLGYSIISIFTLLSRLKLINFGQSDIDQISFTLERLTTTFGKKNPTKDNPAKQIAQKFKDRSIVLISANHLVGTAHAIKNMLNENSKTFAVSFDLPELNHHLLEGLSFPKDLKEKSVFIFLNSELYPAIIKKRITITRNLFERLGFQTITVRPESDHPTLQAFECLYFGEFVSYYLAISSHIDPGPIPSVDYFKRELLRL